MAGRWRELFGSDEKRFRSRLAFGQSHAESSSANVARANEDRARYDRELGAPKSKNFPISVQLGGQAHLAKMAYGPVRIPSTQQQPENFLDDLSNSGSAIRLDGEGRATGPPEDVYRRKS